MHHEGSNAFIIVFTQINNEYNQYIYARKARRRNYHVLAANLSPTLNVDTSSEPNIAIASGEYLVMFAQVALR